jgi:alkylation response protein AidB-like acyl-CoA dehydrogenase
MHFDFTDEQQEIREAARGLLQQRSPVARVAAAADGGTRDDALWQEMCDLGWAGIGVPESLSGQGLGLVELCLVLEEQGATLSPTPLLPTVCASRIILHGGSDSQRERWLPALATGTEHAGVGRLDDGEAFVAGVDGAAVAILASNRAGLLLNLDEMPIDPVDTVDQLRSYGRTATHGHVLPRDVARGRDEALVCVAAELLGVARHCLDTTVSYVKERRQFGVPVGSFQAVSHKCAEMLYHVESARAAVYYAAWAADADPEALPEAAAIAKYIASAGAVAVAGAAIQAHGGVGFTWEANLHWWFKRAQLDAQLLGGASAHRGRVGELLAERAGSSKLEHGPAGGAVPVGAT